MVLLLVIVTTAVGLALLVHFYFQHKFNYWKRRGVPFAKPSAPFGNFKEVLFQQACVGQFLQKIYNQGSDNRFYGFYIFSRPAIAFRDPDLIRQILVKDFEYFYNRHVHSNAKSDPLSSNLFLLRGAPWRYLRFKLTPTFTTYRMKQMLPLISKCASQLTEYLGNTAKSNNPIEVKETLAKYATDVISTCAFGIESNCLVDPNAEFREFGRKTFNFSVYRSFEFMSLFMLPLVVKMMNVTFFQKQTTVFLRDVFWETIRHREENNIVREDFMELLIQLKNRGRVDEEKNELNQVKGKNDEINDENGEQVVDFEFKGNNLVAQAAIFFAAGFESNATTSTFTLYELALQPHLQDRLRAEIIEVTNREQGKMSYEALKSMTYLHMVVSETLRKFPPLPFIDRIASNDYVIPGTKVVIEKGTPVFVPLLGLHMDAAVFPDPERYDPERFNEENKKTRHPSSYLPFGEGPRYCIGRRFGVMAAKMAVVNVISQFQVSPCDNTPFPLVLNPKALLLASKGGIPLRFTKLKK